MLYFYLFLLFVFLTIITGLFIRSLKSSPMPPNAKVIVDVWNTIAK